MDILPNNSLKLAPNPPKLPRSSTKEKEKPPTHGQNNAYQRSMADFRSVRPISAPSFSSKSKGGIPSELLAAYQVTIDSMESTINEDALDRGYSPSKYCDRNEARLGDAFGPPKLPKPRSMGSAGVKDAEDMRQELYTTRIELNSLKQEKKLLLSRIAVVERSHDDMERRYQDQLIATTVLRRHRSGADDSKDPLLDDKVITKLKTALKNAEKQIKQKDQEINDLKHSTKYRSLQKFEEEINRYYLEVVRLKRLLEHQETGTRLLDDDPEKLLSYDDAISELCIKLTKEQEVTKELTERNDRLSAENNRQKLTIETMTEQLFDLNQRHDSLKSEHLKLTELSDQLGQEHNELKQRFQNLTRQFEKTTSDLESITEKLNQTKLELQEKMLTEERLRVALADLNSQHQKLIEAKQALENETAEQKERDKRCIEVLEGEVDGLKDNKRELEHIIERQTKEYSTELKEKQDNFDREHSIVIALRGDLSNSQQQTFEAQNMSAKLSYEVSAGKDKAAFLEKTIQNEQETCRTLENEISRQKGMCKSLESQLSDRYDKIGVLERKLATFDIQATEMKTKESALEQRILALVNEQLESQKKISGLQFDLTASHQKASILEKAMGSTEEKLFDKQNEVMRCYETINTLQVNIQNIEQRNAYLENAVASLDTQLSEKHDHILQANQIIASLETQLQSNSQQYVESAGPYASYGAGYDAFDGRSHPQPDDYRDQEYSPQDENWEYDHPVYAQSAASTIHNYQGVVQDPTISPSLPTAENGFERSTEIVRKDISSYPALFSRSLSSTNLVDVSHSQHEEVQDYSIKPSELDHGNAATTHSTIAKSSPNIKPSHSLSQSNNALSQSDVQSKPPLPTGAIDRELIALNQNEATTKSVSLANIVRGRQDSRSNSAKSSCPGSGKIKELQDLRRPRSESISNKRSRSNSVSLHRSPSTRSQIRASREAQAQSAATSRSQSRHGSRVASRSQSVSSVVSNFQSKSFQLDQSSPEVLPRDNGINSIINEVNGAKILSQGTEGNLDKLQSRTTSEFQSQKLHQQNSSALHDDYATTLAGFGIDLSQQPKSVHHSIKSLHQSDNLLKFQLQSNESENAGQASEEASRVLSAHSIPQSLPSSHNFESLASLTSKSPSGHQSELHLTSKEIHTGSAQSVNSVAGLVRSNHQSELHLSSNEIHSGSAQSVNTVQHLTSKEIYSGSIQSVDSIAGLSRSNHQSKMQQSSKEIHPDSVQSVKSIDGLSRFNHQSESGMSSRDIHPNSAHSVKSISGPSVFTSVPSMNQIDANDADIGVADRFGASGLGNTTTSERQSLGNIQAGKQMEIPETVMGNTEELSQDALNQLYKNSTANSQTTLSRPLSTKTLGSQIVSINNLTDASSLVKSREIDLSREVMADSSHTVISQPDTDQRSEPALNSPVPSVYQSMISMDNSGVSVTGSATNMTQSVPGRLFESPVTQSNMSLYSTTGGGQVIAESHDILDDAQLHDSVHQINSKYVDDEIPSVKSALKQSLVNLSNAGLPANKTVSFKNIAAMSNENVTEDEEEIPSAKMSEDADMPTSKISASLNNMSRASSHRALEGSRESTNSGTRDDFNTEAAALFGDIFGSSSSSLRSSKSARLSSSELTKPAGDETEPKAVNALDGSITVSRKSLAQIVKNDVASSASLKDAAAETRISTTSLQQSQQSLNTHQSSQSEFSSSLSSLASSHKIDKSGTLQSLNGNSDPLTTTSTKSSIQRLSTSSFTPKSKLGSLQPLSFKGSQSLTGLPPIGNAVEELPHANEQPQLQAKSEKNLDEAYKEAVASANILPLDDAVSAAVSATNIVPLDDAFKMAVSSSHELLNTLANSDFGKLADNPTTVEAKPSESRAETAAASSQLNVSKSKEKSSHSINTNSSSEYTSSESDASSSSSTEESGSYSSESVVQSNLSSQSLLNGIQSDYDLHALSTSKNQMPAQSSMKSPLSEVVTAPTPAENIQEGPESKAIYTPPTTKMAEELPQAVRKDSVTGIVGKLVAASPLGGSQALTDSTYTVTNTNGTGSSWTMATGTETESGTKPATAANSTANVLQSVGIALSPNPIVASNLAQAQPKQEEFTVHSVVTKTVPKDDDEHSESSGTASETESATESDESTEVSDTGDVKSVDNFWADQESIQSGGTVSADEEDDVW